jgi:hypothetical protein
MWSADNHQACAFTNASKHGQKLTFTTPPKPRVLDYLRTFTPLVKDDVIQ